MNWKTIQHHDLEEKIQIKLEGISKSLVFSNNLESTIGLYGGKCGYALFFSYYYKYTGNSKYIDYAYEIINEVFEVLNSGFKSHTFSSGYSGILWTLNHLNRYFNFELDISDVENVLHDYIRESCIKDLGSNHMDFMHGGLSSSVYFLSRVDKLTYIDHYQIVLDKMKQHFSFSTNGIYHEYFHSYYNRKVIDFGMAHGMSAIIRVLTKFLEVGLDQSEELIRGMIAYFNYHILPDTTYDSVYPGSISVGKEVQSSRLAWCYGDPGVATALFLAGKALNDDAIIKQGIDTMLITTHRRSKEETYLNDAGLCHGYLGVSHIYNRFYHYTKMVEFKDVMDFWLKESLDFANFEDGFAGFKAYHPTEDRKNFYYKNVFGFLEGIAGIGLGYISAISNIEPLWDEALLLS